VDGELDLLRSLEMDRHLQECGACAQFHRDLQAVRTAIKERAPYFPAPASLRKRLQVELHKSSKAERSSHRLLLGGVAIAASLGFVLFGVLGLLHLLSDRSTDLISIPQLIVASYVRSQQLPNHRVDVESSDQHTVKPWFDGKLDYSLSVPRLKEEGFNLFGGRLDYLENRAVAALVYQRRKHIIDLFIWPATPDTATTATTITRQGYHLVHWTQGEMAYWAVSDLNEAELQEFVRLVREKSR
jgi:anti-sigma factor RsiW